MSRDELLDIVDENDVIIGQDTRENVHKKGLLHREIHVWFITPDGKMIFQHRGPNTETYPDLLDATVGGHVDLGMNYDDTAFKEMLEETGIKADINDLHFLKKVRTRSVDPLTGKINNTFRSQYAYLYEGNISDLKIEKGKAVGFEELPIERITNLSSNEQARIVPVNYSTLANDLLDDIKKLISNDK